MLNFVFFIKQSMFFMLLNNIYPVCALALSRFPGDKVV